MSIQRYRDDDPRTAQEIVDSIEHELQLIRPNAPVLPGTQNYALLNALASTLADHQEQSLNDLYNAAYITDATGIELEKRASGLGIERNKAVAATGVAEFTRSDPATTDYLIQTGTTISTGGDNPSKFDTTQQATIEGPTSNVDTTLYSTSNTSYTTKTSFTVDTTYRDTIDVSGDIRTTNGSYVASLRVYDVTNSGNVDTFSTSNTSLTTVGPTTYDVSGMTGDITLEFQIKIGDASASAELDNATVEPGGETGVKANIKATETGPIGNVGANTITVLVEKPTGVEKVSNPHPTGDNDYTLTDGSTPLRLGQYRESDESLRDRALESAAVGGAGTAAAAELALENIDDVISADVFTNRTDSTQNNVDPWHTEVRVFGGGINDIADQLYDVLPLITLKTLQGGANGTLEDTTLTGHELYGDIYIPITRPTEVTLEITIDLVHDATYAGTDAVKDAIVNYVGGTNTKSRRIHGLGQGENVIVNEVENVAEDVGGVVAVTTSTLDSDGDGTDDTTTDSDGVQVFSVTDTEVPVADAVDITVNETAR